MADYIKKRTHIINHVRFLEAGPVARDLYDWGMLWSGQQETDGEIPMPSLLASPWGAGGKKNVVVAAKLIDVGLWERTDSGYRILRWAEQGNTTKHELDGQREAARMRMRARRGVPQPAPCSPDVRANEQRTPSEQVHRTNADVPVSVFVSVSSDLQEGESERETSGARYQAAYAAGVTRGKGAPWVWPGTKYADWDLGKIIKGHAVDSNQKPYKGEQLLRCIEATAAEFASSVIADRKAQYYSAFEPRGCLKWLNESDMAEEARRVG